MKKGDGLIEGFRDIGDGGSATITPGGGGSGGIEKDYGFIGDGGSAGYSGGFI